VKSGFLKNYTSAVPVSETIRRIESVLIRCGVQSITKEYGVHGEIAALRFEILTHAERPAHVIRLPANKEQALEALWNDYANGDKRSADGETLAWSSYKRKKKKDFEEQAERTAWKLMQDWCEVQLSLVSFKQAEVLEVFLPYLWDGEETLFSHLRAGGFKALDGGFKALLPEKCN
jgi:hypothetical protein